MTCLSTREDAFKAGRIAWQEGKAPLHDLTGHMNAIGVPAHFQTAWLNGLESAIDEEGLDTDPDSDGFGWERKALSAAS